MFIFWKSYVVYLHGWIRGTRMQEGKTVSLSRIKKEEVSKNLGIYLGDF